MPVNRKRAKRDHTGSVSPWVPIYLKSGKTPKEGEPGYDEFCGWYLFAGATVPGLPTYDEIDTAKKRKKWNKKNDKQTC